MPEPWENMDLPTHERSALWLAHQNKMQAKTLAAMGRKSVDDHGPNMVTLGAKFVVRFGDGAPLKELLLSLAAIADDLDGKGLETEAGMVRSVVEKFIMQGGGPAGA